jgi:phosphopantothenoylcysteine decarboxylase/phosphopantothenate--cysteine ligase
MIASLKGKSIVLGVSGGIAAYKSIEVLRLLQKSGADVRVVMTRNAEWFVGRMSFEAISGHSVFIDMFGEQSDPHMRHINWAQEADAVIIAPATADIIGKLASGIADDVLSTFMLVVTAPRLVCPSMNTNMYDNPALQRNLERLRADGYQIVEPGAGELACGTVGAGRLPDPAEIVESVARSLTIKDFSGLRVLVTAGPTREPIDPVRFVSNPSSGKMGYAIARAAAARGGDVLLISGPTALADPAGIPTVRIETAAEMAEAVLGAVENTDVIVKVAAVSDYRPVSVSPQKLKKGPSELLVQMEKTEDILASLGRRKRACQILVGFAAETEDLANNAGKKLEQKNLDMIVGNLVGAKDAGFSSDTNRMTLFFRDGRSEEVPLMGKDQAAHLLLDRVRELKK